MIIEFPLFFPGSTSTVAVHAGDSGSFLFPCVLIFPEPFLRAHLNKRIIGEWAQALFLPPRTFFPPFGPFFLVME